MIVGDFYIPSPCLPLQDDGFGNLIACSDEAEQRGIAFLDDGNSYGDYEAVVADSYPDAFDNFPFWD